MLRRRGSDLLVECQNCKSVHSIRETAPKPAQTRAAQIRIIVSRGESSERYRIELPSDHRVAAEDELIVDDPSAEEVHLAEVTTIESGGKRVASAVASEIDTIWARAIDEVTLKITTHDGSRTESERLHAFGDQEFIVGDIVEVGRKKFRITRIKTYKSGFRKYEGDVVLAKDIKRIFAERVGRFRSGTGGR